MVTGGSGSAVEACINASGRNSWRRIKRLMRKQLCSQEKSTCRTKTQLRYWRERQTDKSKSWNGKYSLVVRCYTVATRKVLKWVKSLKRMRTRQRMSKYPLMQKKWTLKRQAKYGRLKHKNYCGIDVTDSSNEEDISSNPNKEDNERSVGKVMASGWGFSINRIQIIIFKGMKRI